MAQIGLLRPAKHRPGHKPERNIFISLCCSHSAVVQRFVMTERSLRPARAAGGGGLSSTPPRPCHPLPSQSVLALVRHLGGSCPGGDMEFPDQRSCQWPVSPGLRQLGISQLGASLPAAVTRVTRPRSASIIHFLSHRRP